MTKPVPSIDDGSFEYEGQTYYKYRTRSFERGQFHPSHTFPETFASIVAGTHPIYRATTMRPDDFTFPIVYVGQPQGAIEEAKIFEPELGKWRTDYFITQTLSVTPVGVFFIDGSDDFTYNGWVSEHPKGIEGSPIPHFPAVQFADMARRLEATADFLVAVPPYHHGVHPKSLNHFHRRTVNHTNSIRNWGSGSNAPAWKSEEIAGDHDYGKSTGRIGEITRSRAGKAQFDETQEGLLESEVARNENKHTRIGGAGIQRMADDLLAVNVLFQRGHIDTPVGATFFLRRLNERLALDTPPALPNSVGNPAQDFAVLLQVATSLHETLSVTVGGHSYFRKLPNPLPDDILQMAGDAYAIALAQPRGDEAVAIEGIRVPDLGVTEEELEAFASTLEVDQFGDLIDGHSA